MGNVVNVLNSLPWFVLLLGALIFVHELGHFAFAKLFDIKVLRFSFGFGPRLFGTKRGDTDYCVSALPLGGYVKMLGETFESDVPEADRPRAFSSKPMWQRAIIAIAGPAANVGLALFVYVAMYVGPQTLYDTRIGIVTPDGPAFKAGIRPGDRIVALNGQPVSEWKQILRGIGGHPGAQLSITYARGSAQHTVAISPESQMEANVFQEQEKRGRIGISLFYVKPIIAVVDPQSPAAKAGLHTDDILVQVNGQNVGAWHEVRDLIAAAPAGKPVEVTVKRDEEHLTFSLWPAPPKPGLDSTLFSAADAAGGYLGLVSKDTIVAKVEPDSPAQGAGLEVGDRLLRLDRQSPGGQSQSSPISVWTIDLGAFQGSDAHSRFTVTFQRGDKILTGNMQLAEKLETDEFKNRRTRWVFGAENAAETLGTYTFTRTIGLGEAIEESVFRVGEDVSLIARGLERLLVGRIPLDNVGGPIMLFVLAEKSARHGMEFFWGMMAVISVNLGLLNLLPIPVLDGGHLIFLGLEALRRRPTSPRTREVANAIGLALIFLLMLLAFRNDFIKFILG
jgi:regulator of sigma E protease